MSIDGGLRKIFRENLPDIDWTSIETGSTGRGVPDSNGCKDGCEFWIEYKKADAWAVTLRSEQVGWLTKRARFGGRVFVAIRRRTTAGPSKGRAVDELWLYSGADARRLLDGGINNGPEPLYTGGSGP